MYNKFLEKYLDYTPEKVVSKKVVVIRKIISPGLRFVVPFVTPNSKLTVVRRAKLPKQPVIFAATHGFREDIEHTVVTSIILDEYPTFKLEYEEMCVFKN